MQTSFRYGWFLTCRVEEWRLWVVGVAGGDPLDGLPGPAGAGGGVVAEAALGADVPGEEVDDPVLGPRAVRLAQVLLRHTHHPVGTRLQLKDPLMLDDIGHYVVVSIHSAWFVWVSL